MPKYKVGDILESKKGFANIKIMAVIEEIYCFKNLSTNNIWLEEETFFGRYGYTLTQPARWVPEEGEAYCFVNDKGGNAYDCWQNEDRHHHFRLSIGNVFQVGDHVGIEALKRKWQEVNNTYNS